MSRHFELKMIHENKIVMNSFLSKHCPGFNLLWYSGFAKNTRR